MKKLLFLMTSLFSFCLFTQAQDPLISPAPGFNSVCPGTSVSYSVIPGPNFDKCGVFTWTITNGSFNFNNSNTTVVTTASANESVQVFWKDVAGTGTLTVTSNCTTGGALSSSSSYAIRSLGGRNLANPRKSQDLQYCTTPSIYVAVDVMFLENTGGTTGVPQQRADGYEWVLPAGWSSGGLTTIRTTTEYLNIIPSNGCSGGSVTVKAYVSSCSGYKYSNPATISLNRPSPTLSITAPNYSPSSCGSNQAVTFTVTPVACASDYKWVFSGPNSSTPSGWQATPVSTGTTNYITVQSSGTSADAGSVKVTVTLSCNTQLTSTTFPLTFTSPAISSPSAICYGGSTVTLNNVASNVPVTWTATSNMSVLSGQGTTSAVLRSVSSSTREAGTIYASVSCATVPPKTVWVGKPKFTTEIQGRTQLTPGMQEQYYGNVGGASSVQWFIPSGCYQNYCWELLSSYVRFGQATGVVFVGKPGYYGIEGKISNSCGTDIRYINVNVQNPSGGGGGGGGGGDCGPGVTISPNPSSGKDIIVSIIYPPDPCEPCPTCLMGIDKTSEVEYALYDKNNNKVKSGKSKEQKIDVHTLKPDAYVLRIVYNNKIYNEHIIVE